ncbi:transposase family protein [Streptomyces sp. NPDC006655]|uniref:transposase family protein n=1 Tax=Streptomyces sp. NPDC006655 TaxID=3156898 RepID=UPI003454468F
MERLAGVPDPRDPRGVRHRPAVVLVLTPCAVPTGATSLLAVGEWIRRRRAGPGGRAQARRPTPENDGAARPGSGRQKPARRGQGEGPQGSPAGRAGAHHRPGPCPVGRRRRSDGISQVTLASTSPNACG